MNAKRTTRMSRRCWHNALAGVCGFILAFCLGTGIVRAAWREVFTQDAAARRAFQTAVQDFRNGEYELAEQQFRTLLPADRIEDEEVVALFVAKCLLGRKLYTRADEWLGGCRDKYAAGRYADMFFYLSGHAAYLTKKPLRAAQLYLEAYRASQDEHLRELTLTSLEPLFARWLDDTRLSGLAKEVPEGPVGAALHYYLGLRRERQERFGPAEKDYQEVMREGRNTRFSAMAQERLAKLRRTRNISTRIGLLCPATGTLVEFGEQMRRAAALAAEAWRKNTGGSVEIVTEDTRGNPLDASTAARRVIDQGVAAVVGPLTSESAIAAANVVACAELVQVLPVASQSGLTALSDRLYQLSYVPERIGESLARFLVDSLGDSTLTILAPDDAYGRAVGEAFQKAALGHGADVFQVQYYQRGQTDFSVELMRVKKVILRERYDSTVFISAVGDTMDEQSVPVRLGGIFLPGDAEDLINILPQIRFFNIFARVLGTDGLSDREHLAPVAEYLDGGLFASAEHHPADDKQWGRFLSAWNKRYRDEPTLVAARTYDAVTLAASLVAGQWPPAPKAGDSTAIFDGVSGTIKFSPERVNISVELYGYQGGRVVPAGSLPPFRPNPEGP